MANPTPRLERGRREAVVAYAWGSPTVTISAEGQLERIRRHCFEQKWEIVAEIQTRRFADLGELARQVVETEAQHLALTREAVEDLQQRLPELWSELQARFQARDVTLVVV